jgi:membrane protein implicated in regulation of membrane protease activity
MVIGWRDVFSEAVGPSDYVCFMGLAAMMIGRICVELFAWAYRVAWRCGR